MPFQKGHKFGKGRPPKAKKQAKDWIEAHPYAVGALMQVLYEKGIDGDREAATYVIDRIKGKPKQQTDIEMNIGLGLSVSQQVELMQILTENRRIIEGGEIVQGQIEAKGSYQESSTEA